MKWGNLTFSLWADFIERDFLEGEFQSLIAQGVINGATSNPAIFKNAFTKSKAYETQKAELGLSGKALYEALAITHIQRAADLLKPLYDAGNEGFVSIEVDPFYAHDTAATIQEGMKLYEAIGRENVMIKVPATNAGYEAMRTLMSKGIHVNATLIFSMQQAKKVLKAMKEANAPKGTRGVISIFVSRFDRIIDDMVDHNLKGMAGVLNASRIHNEILEQNIQGVTTLFASTGVKDKTLYDESYYIDELLGDRVINTAPIDTIQAYLKEGSGDATLPRENAAIDQFFAVLHSKGIDFQLIADELLKDGLLQFQDAFRDIIKSLEG